MKSFKTFLNYLITVSCSFLLLLGSVKSAWAITYGTVDGNLHPQVVMLVFDHINNEGNTVRFRCSGTLLSGTVVLTAGHCTTDPDFGPAVGGRVYPCTDLETTPIPEICEGFPTAGGIDMASINLMPGFNFPINDLAVVTIAEGLPGPYGILPPLLSPPLLDTKQDFSKQLFTVVGYGLQSVTPRPSDLLIRFFATTKIKTTNRFSGNGNGVLDGSLVGNIITFSNNTSQDNGGTCFGDSGGPAFLGTDTLTIVGVTSFGNPTCHGSSVMFRVDTELAQQFILPFIQ